MSLQQQYTLLIVNEKKNTRLTLGCKRVETLMQKREYKQEQMEYFLHSRVMKLLQQFYICFISVLYTVVISVNRLTKSHATSLFLSTFVLECKDVIPRCQHLIHLIHLQAIEQVHACTSFSAGQNRLQINFYKGPMITYEKHDTILHTCLVVFCVLFFCFCFCFFFLLLLLHCSHVNSEVILREIKCFPSTCHIVSLKPRAAYTL